ncbi:Gfo/Idh/MocA family oxidoreductase [Pseudokineococcus marinus]|uniref:Gfo/Idh/MocA family oxidoreductase n=1 Tax=Pseudokineococcus marinus TaxID=351215 RepID=A0A849BMH4_9ACTN|nr:Gfo/Idh/MocA family oxidoreductase [Pseudokineococcus marinus]NNH22543.1 Gfo/Idh/MocA family oxidoreductase [Pseudokineococcus marinus]
MTEGRIGVGVVGLSARGGWGAGAHLPAMAAAGGFELRGLVAGSPESARVASQRFSAPAYASAGELAAADDVDLVVVAVKTPRHRELVLPALAAGAAVLCEWPVAVDRAEAEEMAAHASGRPTFVGLHGRSAPAFRYLADLVADGCVGDLLSVTLVSAVTEWGTPVSRRMAYTLDRTQGATMLAIAFGHAIDPVLMATGELRDVVATTAVRRTTVPLEGTGRAAPVTADDQVAVSGTLPGGAVLSAHQRGGVAAGPGFSVQLDGTAGTLVATAPDHPHLTTVTIRGARRGEELAPVEVPAGHDAFPHLGGTPLHALAHAYAGVREELHGGPRTVPDLAHAVRRHALLDAVLASAASGRRVDL